MPEEINRLITDAISDLLLVTEQSGLDNLQREGVADSKVRMTGNVMIDTLVHHLGQAEALGMAARLGLTPGEYVLVTLHRPSNVDNPAQLADLTEALLTISRRTRVVFPMHPRTRGRMEAGGLYARLEAAHGRDADRAAGLPVVPLAGGQLPGRADRFGRDSGGDDLPAHSLHYAAAQHRAALDGRDRHERTGDAQ